ncbi:MAG: DUF4143 domain-containing protein, partial [Simkania negevensis]|nr:DUF4143 domain-containing protein [Simkania negevensis]
AVIAQFNSLEMRNDVRQLWENFIFMERLKKCSYTGYYGSRYFWRTYRGQEIDLIEEIDNKLSAFEIKWSDKKNIALPSEWKENYPDATFHLITPENYLKHIT